MVQQKDNNVSIFDYFIENMWYIILVIAFVFIVIWYFNEGMKCIGTSKVCSVIPSNITDSIRNSLGKFY